MKSLIRSPRIVFITGILIEAFYLSFVFLNDDGNIPLYMFIYFEVFILFFAALYLYKKLEMPVWKSELLTEKIKQLFNADDETAAKLKLPLIIILFGLLFRITLIPTVPTTSPDVYRYVWEGKIILHGYNPYHISPNNAELEHLRDEVYDKINFKEMPAIYPPFGQIIFAASYFISGNNLTALKLFYLIFEILTLFFLLKLLIFKKKNPNLVLLYAWLPLPVMEFFINAHLDPIGISFLVMFLYLIEKDKTVLSAIPFAFSFLTKFYPLILLPLLIKKAGVKNFFIFCLLFAVVSGAVYLPFIYKDIYILNFLVKYISRWEFNGSVYNLIKYFSDSIIARQVCTLLLIITAATIATRYVDFTKAAFGVFLAFIIFSATLYPWYLGWIAVMNPFAGFASIMSLFFTVNASNFTPLGDVWREYTWVLLIQYVPFFGLLAYDLFYKKRL